VCTNGDGDGRLRWLRGPRGNQTGRRPDAKEWLRRNRCARCRGHRRATQRANGIEHTRNRGQPFRLKLRVQRRRRRLFDHEGASAPAPNELGERVQVLHVGRMEQIAQVCLGEIAVTDERSDLSGDGVTLFAYSLFARGERIGQSNGELTRSRIARGLDRVFDEREVGGAIDA